MKQCFVLFAAICGSLVTAQNNAEQEKVNMAEMMAKAKQYTAPGPNHKILEKLLGTWDTDTRFVMGGTERKPELGQATCTWLMAGRWVECRMKGPLMGMPYESFMVFGYDNFKKSFRIMTVSNFDTAMTTSEGDMDPGGKALLTYGTLDEYLTGEHDKMVKYVIRFDTPDALRYEVHDLPIGEKNTQVLAMRWTRKAK